MTASRAAHTPPQRSIDVVLGFKWAILAFAVALAAMVYVVSLRLPSTYKSTAVVQVTPPGSAALGNSGAKAGNALAARFARLVRSAPVLGEVSERTGTPTGRLSIALSGGTVNAQNLVAVRATAATATGARVRAAAAAKALIDFARQDTARQAARFRAAADDQLGALDDEIARAQARLDALDDPTGPSGRGARSALSVLLGQRSAATAANARTAAADAPRLELLTASGAPVRLAPHPELYALVALLVAPIVATQLLLVGTTIRRRPA